MRPRSVRVGASRVTLQFDDPLVDETAEATGTYLGTSGVIKVSPYLGHDQQREVTLHEVLHACIDQTNLRGSDKDAEEKLVAALSPVVFGFIRDNPRAVAWLQEVK